MPARKSLMTAACLAGMIFVFSAFGQKHVVGPSEQSVPRAASIGKGLKSSHVPGIIRYDGILSGQSSAEIALSFSIYKSRDAANPLWQETQKVRPDSTGHYTVFLSAVDPGGIPDFILRNSQPQWLGVCVIGQTEQRRVMLSISAYEENGSSLGSGSNSVGGSNKASPIINTNQQQYGSSRQPAANSFTVSQRARPNRNPLSVPSLTTVPRFIVANNTSEGLLVQQNGAGVGLHTVANSNSAIVAETTSSNTVNETISSINRAPDGVGVRAEAQAATGLGNGIWGITAGDRGTGVLGEATQTAGATYGVRGSSASDAGIGVLGTSTSVSGATTGVRGESSSPQGTAGVFDSLAGGNILSGRSAGAEKFQLDSQGNVTATSFGGDGSKLTSVNASSLDGLHASDFARIGLPQNVNGLETLASKQLALNANVQVGAQFGAAAFMREDQDVGHTSPFGQTGPQMHFRLSRAYCDKTSTSQQSPSDQAMFLCVPDAVTIDDTHPASSTPSKDFIIAPYSWGMSMSYPGLIEVTSDEFSIHTLGGRGAHFWVGDDNDLGGILTTAHDAMNADNTIDRSQSFVSITSETFTGASHGDMLFSVRDQQDNFRFQFGPVNAAEAPGMYQQFTKARIDSTGKGFFDGGTQTGGADFAESVRVAGNKANYEPGDVMVIDTDSDRQLKLAKTPYSTLVAGIYSTKPGVTATLHSSEDPTLAAEIPVAIVGIVPCKVTNENGPIARGDLLVSSSKPGYAMRGTDKALLPGAVVGKALQPFSGKSGKIEVLVTLR